MKVLGLHICPAFSDGHRPHLPRINPYWGKSKWKFWFTEQIRLLIRWCLMTYSKALQLRIIRNNNQNFTS